VIAAITFPETDRGFRGINPAHDNDRVVLPVKMHASWNFLIDPHAEPSTNLAGPTLRAVSIDDEGDELDPRVAVGSRHQFLEANQRVGCTEEGDVTQPQRSEERNRINSDSVPRSNAHEPAHPIMVMSPAGQDGTRFDDDG
jgi:hypothetical protein